jgi:hypothetical protein
MPSELCRHRVAAVVGDLRIVEVRPTIGMTISFLSLS